MTDIDQLTGEELQKAVAESVGWEWHDLWCGEHRMMAAHASDNGMVRFAVSCNWEDAMAACEAAGVKTVVIDFGNGVLMESGQFAVGATPESCLRALLHTLAARNSQQPHVAAEGEK